jgi:hypothetical protein
VGLLKKYAEFKDRQREKRIEKSARLVRNPKAIKEDRWAALEYLAATCDAKAAVPALLERFEYSLEHGINDTREKELAMKGIVKYGRDAIPFLREKITKSTRIAWIVKMLQNVSTPDDTKSALQAALNFQDISFDQSAVDKNYDILCYLRDFNLGDFTSKIAHFLNDPDERVRFACVEVLIEQDDKNVPGWLEPFLGDHSAENRRIHNSVVQAFLQRKWSLKDPSVFPEGLVENGVRVSKSGFLEAAT